MSNEQQQSATEPRKPLAAYSATHARMDIRRFYEKNPPGAKERHLARKRELVVDLLDQVDALWDSYGYSVGRFHGAEEDTWVFPTLANENIWVVINVKSDGELNARFMLKATNQDMGPWRPNLTLEYEPSLDRLLDSGKYSPLDLMVDAILGARLPRR